MFKVRETFIPFCIPDVSEREVDAVAGAIRSGWWAKGPLTVEFEKRFAQYVGAKHAIAVNSCTAALHLALLSQDIGPGDEVITSPLTFASTASTIVHTGATPVFADIDERTGCIDLEQIERRITKRTRAVVPVHYSGVACDLDAVRALCRAHGLFLSEDAAHAVETRYHGDPIGCHPMGAASFSFYATKNLATGEGGMLVTDDDGIAERAGVFSCHGMSRNAWKRYGKGGSFRYDVTEFGYKYNMFDLQAALGLTQLERMPQMQAARMQAVEVYERAFAPCEALVLQQTPENTVHSRHLYVLRIRPEALTIDRDRFVAELAERNVGTSVHFLPVHLMSAYRTRFGFAPGDFPRAERFSDAEISLPMYSRLSVEDAAYVAEAVLDIVQKFKR